MKTLDYFGIDWTDREYEVYALRVQDEKFENVGEGMNHRSHIWIDGEETDEELDGVCGIDIRDFEDFGDLMDYAKSYYGDHIALIAGDYYTHGDDNHELVIEDPVVIYIVR